MTVPQRHLRRYYEKIPLFPHCILGLSSFAFAVDANDLLPPEQAFVPQVNVTDQGISVQFKIADGYYMYQSKNRCNDQS